MRYTRTAELEAISLQRLGYSPAYIRKEAMKKLNADKKFRKEVAKNTVAYKKEIAKTIQGIENEAYKYSNKILAGAGDMAWYSDLAVWKQAGKDLNTSRSTLSNIVEGIQNQTRQELKNITRSIGFRGSSGIESVRNLYRSELDKGLIKLLSGISSQDKVVADIVKDLAHSGLRSVDYESGRSDQLDVAVSRALRTGAQQVAGQVQNANLVESGENLVYVESHAGARNEGTGVQNHAQWQGKVYYIEPGHNYSEEEARLGYKIKDLWVETGYSVDGAHENNPLGLFGYNCRHLYYPWFEGVSEEPRKAKTRPDVQYGGKTLTFYEQTQESRRQERNIRALKREKEALQRTGQDTTEVKAKLAQKEREYKAFCTKCNMPLNTTRTRYQSNTADITKTEAYQEYKKQRKTTQYPG